MFPIVEHGQPLASSTQVEARGAALNAPKESWHIPEEAPVAFVYNRRNYAVMMATPQDMAAFALGFSLSEKIVKSADEIKSLDIQYSDKGVDLKFKLSDQALERLDIVQRRRNMVGSSSCGICGVQSAETLFKALPKVSETALNIAPSSLERALKALPDHQPLKQLTRSVHGAAWVGLDGQIDCALEDVGRHNAMDKLLGHLVMTGADIQSGFVLMSSRCSYEIIEKAASLGVRAILSVSAPTTMALRKAAESNMSLYARSGQTALRLN